jgi:hypothetical protein
MMSDDDPDAMFALAEILGRMLVWGSAVIGGGILLVALTVDF